MKKLIFIILLPILIFAQSRTLEISLWGTAADTIGNITVQDTLQYRKYIGGSVGPWNSISTGSGYISAAEKTAETTQEYDMTDDTNWGWMNAIEFRVKGGATAISTLVKAYGMGKYYGAFTVLLEPDTTGTVTIYTLKLGGN